MSDETYEPSLYEYGLDADYGARLHLLHERLFRRIRWLASIVQLASVTAVLGPYLSGKDYPLIAGIGGAVLVAITILDAATDFAGKVHEHRNMRRRFEELSGRIPKMSLDGARAALRDLNASDDTLSFECLRVPAYNDNLRRHGRDAYVRPLRWLEAISAAIA